MPVLGTELVGRKEPRSEAASSAATTKLAASTPNGSHTAKAIRAPPSGMPRNVLVVTSAAEK